MSAQTMTATNQSSPASMVNNRLLLNGGLLTMIGGAIAVTGTSMVAAAVLSAVRQWSQSEQRHMLAAKARSATAAASTAWKQGPDSITLPDAASGIRTPTRA